MVIIHHYIKNTAMSETHMCKSLFSGMTACLDEAIANVTAALKKSGMYDNTVIVFSTGQCGM